MNFDLVGNIAAILAILGAIFAISRWGKRILLQFWGSKGKYNEVDLSLFREFIELFSEPPGNLAFLKTQSFDGAWNIEMYVPFRTFRLDWGGARHEFIDKQLESEKKKAHALVDKFSEELWKSTFLLKGYIDMYSMYPGVEVWTREMVNEKDTIHQLATNAYEALQKFERLGRKKFRSVGDL